MIQYMYKYMPKYYIAHITLIHTHTQIVQEKTIDNEKLWKSFGMIQNSNPQDFIME